MKSQNKNQSTTIIKELWPLGCESCIYLKLSSNEIKQLIDRGYYFNSVCSSCSSQYRANRYI